MGLQGDNEVEHWGVNIYIDGGAAWGVTREDRRYLKLELEAPKDGQAFPQAAEGVRKKLGRCLSV